MDQRPSLEARGERGGRRPDRAVEEGRVEVVVPGGLELGRLVRDLAGDQGRRAGEQVAVGRHAGGALEGVAEEEREGPAVLAVAACIPWPPRRRGRPRTGRAAPPARRTGSRLSPRRSRLADAASASAGSDEERLDRPAAEVGRARRTTVSISRVPEPEWQQSRITATCGPFAATSPISLAISLSARSQLPGLRLSKQDERLVEVVRLELPELLGGLLLRAVAAVVEERDVALLRLAEVVAEAVDDRLAGGLAVLERLHLAMRRPCPWRRARRGKPRRRRCR